MKKNQGQEEGVVSPSQETSISISNSTTEFEVMQNFRPETGELLKIESIITENSVLAICNIFELAAKLPKLKDMSRGIAISSTYLEMTAIGETIRGIFIRYKWIAPKYNGPYRTSEEIPLHERENFICKEKILYRKVECVEFVDERGGVFMCGGIQFLNSFKERFVEFGQEFMATYKGKKDKTKLFEIVTLNDIQETEYLEVE